MTLLEAPRPKVRVTIGLLMALVACVAVSLVYVQDSSNRTRRNVEARTEAKFLAEIAGHVRELAFCREQSADVPYDFSRLHFEWQDIPRSRFRVKSWDEEIDFRMEMVRYYRPLAEQAAERKRYFQRRLLIP